MPSISSSAPLRSSESSVSSCSDVSVIANYHDRAYVEDSSTDSGQEDSGSSLKSHMDNSNLQVNINGFLQADDMVKHENREATSINSLVDVQVVQGSNGERPYSSNDEASLSPLLNDEVDAEFWDPPDAEDQEDDVDGSVANYDDDDDEYGDGVTWTKPSSFSSFGEDGYGSCKFKEEKLQAMNSVKNGKFRALVSQLVNSVGVDSSGICDENWVDIVTNLSWDAAAFVKPDAREGKAMDPDGYVKVKCIATGSRSQSQLVKGLVFKKHAAHKHMATNYQNPRLLLIYGSLDLSSGGLSSFESMKQEKDTIKSIVDMIDMHHPNVVLVEKSVSRSIQESILQKGITLIIDMKPHRLERVARCIGSPILVASEVTSGQKLRQCDSFRVEKFVEEHDVPTEGGKQPRKTLMFLEGAPSRLGCTILLMGASSDELKRIKCVVRCSVVMAYHLMLETSFLLDQSAMFSTISTSDVVDLALANEKSAAVVSKEAAITFDPKQSDSTSTFAPGTPTCNRFHKFESQDPTLSSEPNSPFYFEARSPATFPGLSISASVQKVMDDSFPLLSDTSQSKSSSPGFYGRNQNGHSEKNIKISGDLEVADHYDDQPKVGHKEENLCNVEQPCFPDSSNMRKCGDGAEDQLQSKKEINSVLDSESILVLRSSRNASRGTVCEQSRFSHITFYRSFDVPLGKFLQDNLLNQRLQCKTCEDQPEAHFFYYAHHNKQLMIQVRCLPARKSLPGESDGKLWMWSRCGRCKLKSKSTKRVLISSAARGLSFGKFLELGFSNHSSFNPPSSCGHSFHKDFLYFFGLGTMIAMFKYCPVVTYSVSLPLQQMGFNSSVRGEFLKNESQDVYSKGISIFVEIEKSLKDLRDQCDTVSLNINGSCKKFSDIVETLNQEKSQFEAEIQNAINIGAEEDAVCKFLSLNRVRMELLLESCIWDQRLDALHSPDLKLINSDSAGMEAQEKRQIEGETEAKSVSGSLVTDVVKANGSEFQDFSVKCISEDITDVTEGKYQQSNFNSLAELQTDTTIVVATSTENATSDSNHSLRDKSLLSMVSNLESDKDCIWVPFKDIRDKYYMDLQRGNLPKFEYCSSYATESVAQGLISDEGTRLHIPLGPNNYIVSDYEDEFSSIIACALALIKDAAVGTEDLAEDAQREKGIYMKSNESSQSLPWMFSVTAPSGSLDSDGNHSPPTNSLRDSHSSSFDGVDLLNTLVSYGANHPEVPMGLGKSPGSCKYSVVCVYATEFRQLRDRCCPSEVSYIASLSHCRNWDAKGGKSKSFFAKTLDDRFIIKEIKRTEFDSFMTFAPNYFEYMNQCYELGNQTCLAKILGIYQVVIRATANGKEAKHDLLVMENLSFGRQLSRQYDLKGALHSRFNTAGNGTGDVLLDQNFVNDMNDSPLYASRKSKHKLQRAVYNDTSFLNSVNVMDYSLLVGVDMQRQELVCGIIDYLRQYTWDKQLENWVKSSLVPRNQMPTIISPKEYKKRFRKFIDTHFLSVPDHWCSRRSSNPCKLCGPMIERTDSLHIKPVKHRDPDADSSCATSPEPGKPGGGFFKPPHSCEENGFFT